MSGICKSPQVINDSYLSSRTLCHPTNVYSIFSMGSYSFLHKLVPGAVETREKDDLEDGFFRTGSIPETMLSQKKGVGSHMKYCYQKELPQLHVEGVKGLHWAPGRGGVICICSSSRRSLTSVRIISHAAKDLLHSTNNIWLEFALMIRMLLVRKWREHSFLRVDHCHGKAYWGARNIIGKILAGNFWFEWWLSTFRELPTWSSVIYRQKEQLRRW